MNIHKIYTGSGFFVNTTKLSQRDKINTHKNTKNEKGRQSHDMNKMTRTKAKQNNQTPTPPPTKQSTCLKAMSK